MDEGVKDSPRTNPRLEAGFFLAVVALPIVFAPFTAAPFADPKLVVLCLATLLLATAKIQVDRAVAIAAVTWMTAVFVAALAGLDPLWSVLGAENQSTGFVGLAGCVALLCAATGAGEIRHRMPNWLFWTGVAVAIVAIVGRFVELGGSSWMLGRYSSTIGDRVYVGGFLAVPILAATRLSVTPIRIAGLAVIASGFSIAAVRSAWIGAAVALVIVFCFARADRRTVIVVSVTTLVVLGTWTVIDRQGPKEADSFVLSAAPRFAELNEGSAQERVPVWRANIRAWTDHPVLGTGPATGWHGYLSEVTADEMRIAGRGYGDAHNIAVELLATTGLVGIAAAVALGVVLFLRIGRPEPEQAWAAGAAIALGVVHLLQPLNLTLTPLLFLTAGLAVKDRGARVKLPSKLVAGVLALLLLIATARFAASALERYGRTYASAPALRAATQLEPDRLGSSLALAEFLAVESRTGDRHARLEAEELIRGILSQRSWHPGVRVDLADVERVLDNDGSAKRLIAEQLRHFPNDPIAIAAAATFAMFDGDDTEAVRLAERALFLDPESAYARVVLDRLTEPRDRATP
jgi:O-antigen ligase